MNDGWEHGGYWANLKQEVKDVSKSLRGDERALVGDVSSFEVSQKSLLELQREVKDLETKWKRFCGIHEEGEKVEVEAKTDDGVSSTDGECDWEQYKHGAPFWKWADIGDCTIFCWPTNMVGAWPTEVWKFIFHDGTITYSLRPPATWDIKTGDTAKPTPYGAAISKAIGYYKSQNEQSRYICGVQCEDCGCLDALGNAFDLLSHLTEEELQEVPDDAVLYDSDIASSIEW